MRTKIAIAGMFLLAIGCKESLPTAPTTSTSPPPEAVNNGMVWGYVFDTADGKCLIGARVEITAGPHTGEQYVQTDCDFDSGVGYQFRSLPKGETVTLRASAPGFLDQEKSSYVNYGGSGQFNFILTKQ